MTDTLSGEDGWGPPRPKQHLPTPKPRAHPPDPKRPRRPLGPGRAHGASYSTKGGGPRKTDAERGWTWPSWEAPLALHLSPQGPRLRGLARAGQPESFPRRSPPEPPRSPRGGGGGPRLAGRSGCSRGLARRHMMAQRLRRSAPWKRRAACTCLQRAQPTLLSSSLKSSRMCQLYLAEHST